MRKLQNRGFTLVEILVTITITSLIFGIGFIGFREFSRRQQILGALKKVEVDLRLAQGQALAGKKPADAFCDTPNTLNGIEFYVESTTNYKIRANCTGGVVDIKSTSMVGGILISSSPSIILFKVLGGGTNLSSDALITLTQQETAKFAVLTVTSVGEIK